MLIMAQEELQRKQETYAHSQAIYEREVRRARKEAFKSSSALLELQEEMKSIRNKYALVKEEVKVQKRKVEDKEQEAFAAQYQLAGLQEDLDSLTQQVKVGDDVKDALRTSLREEESARIAADEEKRALRSRLREEEVARTAVEGKIALMVSKEEDQLTSPKKKSEKRDSLKENEDPEIEEGNQELVMIQRALNMEKQLRQIAEDTIDFMKMECQFKSCSCRIAEVHRKAYIHDNGPAAQLTHKASKNPRISKLVSTIDRFIGTTTTQTSPDSSTEPTITQSLHASPQPQDTIDENNGDEYVYDTGPSAQSVPEASQNPDPSKSIPTATTNIDPSGEPTTTEYAPTSPEQPEDPDDHLITFSPKTGTFCAIPTAVTASSSPETLSPIRVSQFSARPLPPMPLNTRSRHPSPLGQPPLSHSRSPSPTPIKRSATDPSRSSSPTPTTVSREQALEQIRMRRGRARSIAAGLSTPRRPMMGAEVERRDISAPVCGSVSGRESKGF